MRKKNILLASLFFALLNCPVITLAKSTVCPFTDLFTLKAPAGMKILNASTTGNIVYTQHGDSAFTLSCGGDMMSDGDAYVNIGYDNNSKCNLRLHDGPFVTNPSVDAVDCVGPRHISFNGMDHRIVSYDYVLNFG